jgi:hypothetical protein
MRELVIQEFKKWFDYRMETYMRKHFGDRLPYPEFDKLTDEDALKLLLQEYIQAGVAR